jgi:hypothetical protein
LKVQGIDILLLRPQATRILRLSGACGKYWPNHQNNPTEIYVLQIGLFLSRKRIRRRPPGSLAMLAMMGNPFSQALLGQKDRMRM